MFCRDSPFNQVRFGSAYYMRRETHRRAARSAESLSRDYLKRESPHHGNISKNVVDTGAKNADQSKEFHFTRQKEILHEIRGSNELSEAKTARFMNKTSGFQLFNDWSAQ